MRCFPFKGCETVSELAAISFSFSKPRICFNFSEQEFESFNEGLGEWSKPVAIAVKKNFAIERKHGVPPMRLVELARHECKDQFERGDGTIVQITTQGQ